MNQMFFRISKCEIINCAFECVSRHLQNILNDSDSTISKCEERTLGEPDEEAPSVTNEPGERYGSVLMNSFEKVGDLAFLHEEKKIFSVHCSAKEDKYCSLTPMTEIAGHNNWDNASNSVSVTLASHEHDDEFVK